MTWQQQLEEYYAKYKYSFVVQKIADFPYPWLNYNTPEYKDFIKYEKYVSQREVFPDEVVFDIDMSGDNPVLLRAESQKMGEIITQRLGADGVNYSFWHSGGSGCHIHLFFPELNRLPRTDAMLMKKMIIRFFARGMLYKLKDSYGKVQTQSLITIQLEHAPHRKGGIKTLIYQTEQRESKIPEFLYGELEAYKKQDIEYKEKIAKDLGKNKPNSIAYLESKAFADLKDGRRRALFVICAYYKQFNSDEDVLQILKQWNSQVLNNSLAEKELRSTIKSARPGFVVNYINDLFDDIGVNVNHI